MTLTRKYIKSFYTCSKEKESFAIFKLDLSDTYKRKLLNYIMYIFICENPKYFMGYCTD